MQDATTLEQPRPYPVRLRMDHAGRQSRLSALFRIILAIPVLLFLALVGGSSYGGFSLGTAGGVMVGIWAAILVRRRIPKWLFNFQVALHRFTYRAYSYLALLTDRYPAFEGDWLLEYEVEYPERVSRWRVFFWKLITSIPHIIVLFFLFIAVAFVVFIGWFAILLTGEFPKGLHAFVVGVIRWGARVTAYFESLTDEFPPYSLGDDAGAGSRESQTISAVIGGLLAVGAIAGISAVVAAVVLVSGHTKSVDVRLSDVTSGNVPSAARTIELDDVEFGLSNGHDPATTVQNVIEARPGRRLVEFTLTYRETAQRVQSATSGHDIEQKSVRLGTADEGVLRAVLLTVDGVVAPIDVPDGEQSTLHAVFEVTDGDTLEELRAYPDPNSGRHVAWKFR